MSRDPRQHGIVLAVLLLCATGCASPGRSADARLVVARPEAAGVVRAESTTPLDGLYDVAIVNSAVFRAEHEDDDLWPVSGPTDMGSLISCDCPGNGCSSKCALQPGSQVAPTDIWVSPAAQLQQFCASFTQDLTAGQVILKLQQLQGLPPQTGQDACTWQILQVTVDDPQVPAQFFRPCPDPDPTTKGPCPADFEPDDPQVTDAFAAWMAGQAFSSWQVPSGYPWTHLGYTYNWDPAASSIVGTSEYVIPQSSPVQVLGQVPAVELCTQGRLKCP